MKLFKQCLIALIVLMSFQNYGQQLGCSTPTLTIADGSSPFPPISATIPCTYTNWVRVSTSPNSYGYNAVGTATGAVAPCLRFETSLTNTNSATNNSMTIWQGTTQIGSVCTPTCALSIPSNSLYTLYYASLTPTLSHAYVLCHVNPAPNFNYSVMSCYNNTVIASGTWTNTTAGGCQTVTIPANTAIGTSSYAITPTIVPSAYVDFGQGSIYLDTYQMPQGTYTITYTFNSGSCTSTASRTIQITNPFNAAWTTPTVQCSTFPCLNLIPQITGNTGGNFSGFGVATNSFCPVISGAGSFPVTYSVGVSQTCGAAVVHTINVNTTPVANAGPTKTLNCIQTTTVLNGSGGTTYTWTGPGTITNSNTANPTVNSPGTFTVSVTTASCTSTPATVSVIQNTTQPASTAGTSGSITCVTNTISLTAGPGAMSYTWTAPGGSSIVSGTNSANAVGQGTGTYTVLVRDPANGCSRTATVAALINTVQPVPTAGTSGSITCSTNTINLTSGPAAMNYTWTAPGGSSIVGGVNTQNTIGQGPGTYTVRVQNPANGCSATATVAALINTVQPAATAGTSGSITCVTNTINLTSGPAAMNYTWTAPGGSSIIAGVNSQNATGQGSGVYTVTVRNPTNGCSRTATVAALVNTVAPSPVSASTSGTVTCASLAINLSALPAGLSYSWTAPAGSSITSGVTSQNATGSGAGTYTVRITNPTNGCFSNATVAANVNTTVITPTISPTPTITCTNTMVTLTGNPSSGVLYNWTGPGIVGPSNQQTVNVNQTGTYTLTVINTANSCSAAVNSSVPTNTIRPTTLPVATQTITCASPSVQLIGSANPSTCTVVWTGGVCAGANSFTATVCAPGTYTYIATNPANGCQSTPQVATVVPNSSIPQATVVNTGTITCSSTTMQIIATTTASPVTYNWAGPGIVSGAGTPTIVVNVGGNYTLTLTNTSNSCSSIITNSVINDNAAITPTTSATNTITCIATTATVSVNPGTGSYTYNWSGPGIVGTNTLSTATASLGGNYSVTVTNSNNGCVGTAVVAVIDDTVTPTGISINPSTFSLSCATPTTVLTATATGATSYTWIAPSGGSIISGTNSASAGISGAGNYSVIVAGTNGCPAAAVVATISPNNNAPTFTLSNSAPSINCFTANPTVSVTITSTVPITSYSWSPTTGISSPTNTSVVTFTAAGTYTGVITANNGCVSNAIVSVTDDTAEPNVVAGTATAQVISCLNPSVVIAPTYTPSSGLTYTWTGTGIVGTANDASVTVNQNGTYSLSITNTLTGCSNNTIMVSVVGTTTPPTLNITASSTIGLGCLPGTNTVVLTANALPSSGVTYNWSTLSNNDTTIVSAAGIYSVVVTSIVTSCSVAATYTVVNNSILPNVNAGANGVMPCGSTTTMNLNGSSSTPGVTFAWNGPSIISGSNTANPVIDQPGIYTLTVTNPTTGCTDAATVAIVNGVPTSTFTANVTNGFAPLSVNFTNGSIGAISYNWNFGNGSGSTSFNAQNVFNNPGTYSVTLIASSGTCSDTSSMIIIVDNGFSIEIPNVFTPNGDGVNDFFTIKSTGVKEISLEVFNRWGQKMYEFIGAKAAWDGVTGNGNEASEGTYFFFIKATGVDGTLYEKQGTVNLFR